ncbi:MAG TPA: hypothetical protein PKC72_10315 [Chitinophagaceae bacterium]|nr:hypothetical protein [Chitinophagaceae bacterium]
MKKAFFLFFTTLSFCYLITAQPGTKSPSGYVDSTVQFVPTTVGPYCPKKLLGGDREFGGHGPEIWAWIKLRVVNKNQLYADVYLHARETTSDWSETEGNWSKLLYTAPTGYEISGLPVTNYSEVHYVSKPGVSAFSPRGLAQALGGAKGTDVPFKDNGLVSRWNILGDTGGDDISTDDNCNDDTQVAVQLNPLTIKLRKPVYSTKINMDKTDNKLITNKVITTNKKLNLSFDSIAQYLPSTIGPYCPKKLLGGDREFGGHGPEIWAWTKLRIVSEKYIYADVYLHARETVSDWSETEGTWSKLLYTAPDGYKIKEILSGTYSEVHYVSKPGVSAFSPRGLAQALGGAKGTDVPFKDDGLVSRWNIVGDTGGDDISTDDNCNDDTQVAVQLNTMKIKLSRK